MLNGFIYITPRHLYRCICLLWFVAFFSAAAVVAQTTDAAHNGTYSTKYHDSVEIRKMIKLADSVGDTDREKATSILLTAAAKAKQASIPRVIYIAYCNLGVLEYEKGKYYKSIEYLKQAYPYINLKENFKFRDLWYSYMGSSYSSLGKYDQALDYFNRSLAALKGVDKNRTPPIDSADVYNHIAIVWALMGEQTRSLNTFKQASVLAHKKKDSNMVAMLYFNIGRIYYTQKRMAEAEDYYKKTIEVSRNTAYRGLHAGALDGLGLIADYKKDYKTALDYMMQARAVAKTTQMDVAELASMDAVLGNVYLHMKDYAKAKPLLTDAMDKAIAMGHTDLQIQVGPRAARVYKETGDYKTAYKYLYQYSDVKDSVYRLEKAKSIEALTNAKVAEKDKMVLAQQLRITQQKTELQKKNIWMVATILGALFLIAISFALVRNYRHKQTMQQAFIAQLQQKQEINQLKAQVRGEEQERRRIARELHDSIAGQLWAIKLNVDSVQQKGQDDEAYTRKMNTIFRQLTEATQDVRKTAHNLMPDLLLEEGIATALASVCEKIGKDTKLEVDFMEYGEVPTIDKEIELSIYRMVQELIQNVMKHAKDATNLLVQLSCNGTLLNITVEDNGTAFKEREKEDGIGLQQIRKRTAALKGHFDLQSVSGKGTTAYLEFDLQHLL